MDEEDDSYESSSGSEDSGEDTAEEGSDGEANPYADGTPPPCFSTPVGVVALTVVRGVDFGDDVRSTVTGVSGVRSNLTTRTEKTGVTTATGKSKKHKDVLTLTPLPPPSPDLQTGFCGGC